MSLWNTRVYYYIVFEIVRGCATVMRDDRHYHMWHVLRCPCSAGRPGARPDPDRIVSKLLPHDVMFLNHANITAGSLRFISSGACATRARLPSSETRTRASCTAARSLSASMKRCEPGHWSCKFRTAAASAGGVTAGAARSRWCVSRENSRLLPLCSVRLSAVASH